MHLSVWGRLVREEGSLGRGGRREEGGSGGREGGREGGERERDESHWSVSPTGSPCVRVRVCVCVQAIKRT
jgi:hypothetical protein